MARDKDLAPFLIGLGVILALLILSAGAIVVTHGDWAMTGSSLFFLPLENWPWVKTSIVLTLVTYLAAAGGFQTGDDSAAVYHYFSHYVRYWREALQQTRSASPCCTSCSRARKATRGSTDQPGPL